MSHGKLARMGVFVALVALGGAYLVAFGYLSGHSRNFLVVKQDHSAIAAANAHQRSLPFELDPSGEDSGLLGSGWLVQGRGSQMIAHDASLHLVTDAPAGDVLVRWVMWVVTTPTQPVNHLTLSVNGQVLGSWSVSGNRVLVPLQVRVPRELVADGHWRFDFHADRMHATYRAYGDGSDDGQFLGLTRMELRQAAVPTASAVTQ